MNNATFGNQKINSNWNESIDFGQLETVEKPLEITRVTKVTEGGRILRFRSLVIIGTPNSDANGDTYFGFATSNGLEVSDATLKANKKAKKNIKKFNLYENRTLHHDVSAKYKATKIIIRKAPEGTGLIAGSNVREILQIMGIKDAVAKLYGSTNPINVVKVVEKALSTMHSMEYILKMRKFNKKD